MKLIVNAVLFLFEKYDRKNWVFAPKETILSELERFWNRMLLAQDISSKAKSVVYLNYRVGRLLPPPGHF